MTTDALHDETVEGPNDQGLSRRRVLATGTVAAERRGA